MKILFAYDGSESAAAAIAAAGKLFDHDRPEAIVLTVWEPLAVEAVRAVRFAGWIPIPLDVGELDERDEARARELAGHGAHLAAEAGFEARARSTADEQGIARTIIEQADALDADLIVMGTHGLTGVAAYFGSVSTHVLQHGSRPTLVLPAQKPVARAAGALDGTEATAVS